MEPNLPGRQTRSETRRGIRARASQAIRRVAESLPILNPPPEYEEYVEPPSYTELFLPTYGEVQSMIAREQSANRQRLRRALAPRPMEVVETVFPLNNEAPPMRQAENINMEFVSDIQQPIQSPFEFIRPQQPRVTEQQLADRRLEERIAREAQKNTR